MRFFTAPTLKIGAITASVAGMAMVLSVGVVDVRSQGGPGSSASSLLTPDDVTAILKAAAESIADSSMAVAVVDRTGAILGVYRRSQADAASPDVAVSLARTGAFFSNNAAPLSSRTVHHSDHRRTPSRQSPKVRGVGIMRKNAIGAGTAFISTGACTRSRKNACRLA
jgi:uncharacterized protein GlcG (DUF336 family)